VIYFILWTLILYWIHRLAHKVPFLRYYHVAHHSFINNNITTSWHWSNLLLFNDNWKSTIDLWITEVIPTIVFSYVTNQWWLLGFYYVWAALIQESIEHNSKVNIYGITSGRWHLIHHKHTNYNYGLFFPVWDKLFVTNKKVMD
jgi:sterol desaturase/sphingolipid hydroxylase (fatty acid hydroxylase superfamily)